MRSAEFDRETVLRSAMKAFMIKGYAKTNMQELTKATGLHPGSIYCAFTNKRGLLLAAIEQYNCDRSVEFEQFFAQQKPMLDNIKDYLNHIVNQCISCDASQACLLTKAMNEIAEQDEEIQKIISNDLCNWQSAIASKFEIARSQGELKSVRNDTQLAQYLTMGIFGLRTFSHTHPKANDIQQLADQLFNDICRH
ncbi:TetR/AcrR family transcriptional regulator [Aliivibrio kagoshimensis]|uniref:TetR/AcrR family transcriptional regulator n=1 Tax=Aliivibrio kagoshimensis TaxID=2910230 RepID=UPI003D0C0AF8